MLDWLRRTTPCAGSVLFCGSFPLRLGDLELEPALSVEPREGGEAARWAAELRHPRWGTAQLCALRDAPLPPRELVDHDAGLTASERAEVGRCGTLLSVRMDGGREHVLRDRKLLLRFLRAVMGGHGVAVLDHLSHRFWSRASLDEELGHDADLDIESVYTLHAITADGGGPCTWLHSHGLAEIGFHDFDVLRPSPGVLGPAGDLLRALAFQIVEGGATPASSVTLAQPDIRVRLVPVPDFERHASADDAGLRDDPAGTHRRGRVVLCEPADGVFARWSRRVRPSRALSSGLPDEGLIRFSTAASRLMAERARATYDRLRALAEELAELELPVLLKLGYTRDGGEPEDREHLWFEAHALGAERVDATLLNQPFAVERLRAGQRGEHAVELLSDWLVPTPFGPITPRSAVAARFLRERRDEALAELRETRGA